MVKSKPIFIDNRNQLFTVGKLLIAGSRKKKNKIRSRDALKKFYNSEKNTT